VVGTRAQYLRVRPQLADIIVQVAGLLDLGNDVVHLALAYLDRLNARTPRAGARLLAALACMVVAAKFSEVSRDGDGLGTVPSYYHVLAALDNPVGITTKHLVAWERRVLEVLDWRLSSATTSCFVDAYRAKGIFCVDDTSGPELDGPPTPDEQASVCKHITFFCEIATLQGITYAHGASVSAAAAVRAARVINGIHPSWPPALARRLGKTHAHIDACTRTFVHLYRTQYPDIVMYSDALPSAATSVATALPSAPPQGPLSRCRTSQMEKRSMATSSGQRPACARWATQGSQSRAASAGCHAPPAAYEPPSTVQQPSAAGDDAPGEEPGAPETSSPSASSHVITGPRSLEETRGSDLCWRSAGPPPRKAVRVYASPAGEEVTAGADAEASGCGKEKGDGGGGGGLGKRKRAGGAGGD